MTVAAFLRFVEGDDNPIGLPAAGEQDLFPKADSLWYRRGADGIHHVLQGVPTTRALTAGIGLVGGGDLSADRTFDVGFDDATIVGTATGIRFRDGAALSVVGRASNSSGAVADITAASDGHVLRRSGTTVGFGTILAASVSNFDTQVRTSRLDQMAAPGADVPFAGFTITGIRDAVALTEPATLGQLSAVVNGQYWKGPVDATTTAPLPAVTYANGASGVGATLTANANGALPAQDGVTLAVSDTLLVKDQVAGLQNGVYTVTVLGSGGAPFVLTRRADTDTAAELTDATVLVDAGTTGKGDIYTFPVVATVGTTDATPSKTGEGNTIYTADGVTIDLVGQQFSVRPGGIGTTELANVLSAGGPTGSTSVTPVITWDAKGRLTAVTSATITPAAIGAQPVDVTLTNLAANDWVLDSIPIGSGANTLAQINFAANTFPAKASTGALVAEPITDFGLSLVDDANQATAQTTLGLVIGTNVQAFDATLTALAAADWVLNSIPVGQGANTVSQINVAANRVLGRASGDANITAKTVTDAGFAFIAAADVAAETALLNPATQALKGMQSAVDKKKEDNLGTDAIAELLCDPTASTNDTAKIQAWIDALPATGGGTLLIPDQCFIRIDGTVNVNKPDVTIRSRNRRTSGFVITSATVNGFTCSADSIIFENVRFIAGNTTDKSNGTPTLRTAGYAVEYTSAGDSGGCRNCDAIYMWSGFRLSGPLQFLSGCTIREYGANAVNGACVLVDGSGDRFISKLLTDSAAPSAGHAGIRVAVTASLLIDTCQVIHAGLCLDLAPANGVTVPSVEVINTYLDNSVVGLNCTGAGSVLRCKFTNSWFGSMSDSGVKFGPTGTGTVDGLTFENCYMLNNVGGTTVGVNITGALNGRIKFIGCAIAGWTTGVVTTAGTNCWPIFEGCNIGGYAAFGNNTTGFNIGAGTYKGLFIMGCDAVDNTTPLTLGAVTATAGRYRIVDNAGINPRGSAVATPAIGAAGTLHTNLTGFRVVALVKYGATAPATWAVNGVAGAAGTANQVFTVYLDPGATIQFNTTAPASWTWSGM